MIQNLYGKMELLRFTIQQMFLSKKTAVILILSFFPLIIVFYWMYQPSEETALVFFSNIVIIVFLQFVLPLVTLLYGISLINDEISNKTINYLASSPIRREEILLFRYLGYIPTTFTIIALPLTISYLILGVYEGSVFQHIEILAGYYLVFFLGILVYGSFYNFLGIAIKRPLMVGLLFAFIWETLLANLPGKIPQITVMFYLRSMADHLIDIGGMVNFSRAMDFSASVIIILLATGVLLFLSGYIFSKKDLTG